MKQLQQRFEEWAREYGLSVNTNARGEYSNPSTQLAWEAVKAVRENKEVML